MQSDAPAGQDVRQQAEDTAATIAEQAQATADTQFTTQKQRAAATLDTVARTLRDSGQNIRDEQPQIASLTEEAARRVEDFSGYVRQHDLRDLVGETERFARREPLLFLGGAFALGFVAARFLKASRPTGGGGGGQPGGEGGYRWSQGTGFSGTAGVRGDAATSGYAAGATGYGAAAGLGQGDLAGARAGYGSPTPDYTAPMSNDPLADSGDYGRTTSEFGEPTDYGPAGDTAATDLTEPAGSSAAGGYDSGDVESR